MFKFIHAADIHLDSRLHRLEAYEGAPVDEIRQASRRAFEKLIDLAVNEAVDFVLLAGDLFDGDWKDYNTGLYFVNQVRQLKDAGIAVFIISGNHDAAGQMTRSLPYPDNLHHFSPRKPGTKTIDKLNVAVHGQSFTTQTVMDNLALSYPEPIPGYFNIGLLHTSLTGREGHESYAPCTVGDLKSRGYDYWALGHVHEFEMVSDDPPVVFPGCIQGRHIKETGEKGCLLVTVEEGSPPEIVRHPLDVIRWEQLDIDLSGVETHQESLDRFVEAMEKRIMQNEPLPVIARVVFSGKTTVHTQLVADPVYWKESVRSTALSHFGETAWIEKVKVRTRLADTEGQRTGDPGPIRELDQLVTDLKTNDDDVLVLGDELNDLYRKLPVEYRQGEDALDPGRLPDIRRILDEAYVLLTQRLKKEASDG